MQTQAIGICGTDLEIINGEYGSAPPGQDRLIIGHESLGRVAQAVADTAPRPAVAEERTVVASRTAKAQVRIAAAPY